MEPPGIMLPKLHWQTLVLGPRKGRKELSTFQREIILILWEISPDVHRSGKLALM